MNAAETLAATRAEAEDELRDLDTHEAREQLERIARFEDALTTVEREHGLA